MKRCPIYPTEKGCIYRSCSHKRITGSATLLFAIISLLHTISYAQIWPATSPGTFTTGTYVIPSNVVSINVTAIGGGGAGGGARGSTSSSTQVVCSGAGGGGGGCSKGTINVVGGQTLNVTVGAGGSAGAAGNNPGGSGVASVVSYSGGGSISAPGGLGGAPSTGGPTPSAGTGGNGGVGSDFTGGKGGNGRVGSGTGTSIASGGGGGGAGSTGNGGDGASTPITSNTPGTGGSGTPAGGPGVAGLMSGTSELNGASATASNTPGGGGAGGRVWQLNSAGNPKSGGDGAPGLVVISWTTCTAPTGGNISGPSPVCFGITGQVYSVSGVSGSVNNYTWTVPSGASFTGEGTSSITVDWGTAISGNVTCVPSSFTCNETPALSYPVTVIIAPAQPSVISVPSPICQGVPQTYSVTAGADHYSWSNTAGWSGSSTTNSINLTANGTSTIITVTPFSSCNLAGPSRSSSSLAPNLPIPNTPGPIVQY